MAVAETLFGDLNPGGKLPITIPRSVGHVPAYYNYKPSARRGYLFDDVSPLFPFGFGLSYSNIEMQCPAGLKKLQFAAMSRQRSMSTSPIEVTAWATKRSSFTFVTLSAR